MTNELSLNSRFKKLRGYKALPGYPDTWRRVPGIETSRILVTQVPVLSTNQYRLVFKRLTYKVQDATVACDKSLFKYRYRSVQFRIPVRYSISWYWYSQTYIAYSCCAQRSTISRVII